MSPDPGIEDPLELRPLADPAGLAEALGHAEGFFLNGYEDETVSRLRPFARRRLRTSRPFLVLIRTRKPCVRLRCLVFGWNVRFPFMIADPCTEQTTVEKT